MKLNLDNFSNCIDRFKLFCISCTNHNINNLLSELHRDGLNSINIGEEIAKYCNSLQDLEYINLNVAEFLMKILDANKSKYANTGNDIIVIYNLGIMMEPSLELNAVQLLKGFSKSTSLIILWDNQFDIPDRLEWSTQKNNFFLDFSESQLKKLEYAI